MRSPRRWTAISIGIASAAWLQAVPQFRFEHFTVQDGLPDNAILALLQDRRGFLWLGTENGLVRFDGYDFLVFKPGHQPGSLSGRSVAAILEDRQGILWIGTDQGLNRFDPATRTFHTHRHDPDDSASLNSNRVNSLLQDNSGEIWVATENGLDRFDPTSTTLAFQHLQHDPGDPNSLSSNRVRALALDSGGSLWVGTSSGLNRYQPGGRAFIRFPPLEPTADEIHTLYADRRNRLWVGSEAGLDRLDIATGERATFRHDPANSDTIGYGNVFAVHEDQGGVLWAGTIGSDTSGGLNRYDEASNIFTTLQPDPEDPYSLSSFSANALLSDRSGVLWVGTWGGLNKLDRNPERFPRVRQDSGEPASLAGNQVMTLLEDRKGRLWVGTWLGGLNLLEPGSREFQHFLDDPPQPGSLRSNIVTSLCEDSKGRIWVGTWGGGVHRYRPESRDFVSYAHSGDGMLALRRNVITGLLEDEENEGLWLATRVGIDHLDLQTGDFRLFVPPARPGSDRIDTGVGLLRKDRVGGIWLTSQGGALYSFDASRRTFRTYFETLNDLGDITGIAAGEDGQLWIGSRRAGLHRFNPETGDLEVFAEEQGLPHIGVLGLERDSLGNLWIATAHGVSKLDPIRGSIRSYDVTDGLRPNKLGFVPSLSASDGRLLFGGEDGYIAFHPNRIQDNPHTPPVVLTDFKLFTRSVIPGAESLLSGYIEETDAIRLEHWQNDISFEFAALDYRRPDKNRYRFRLAGYGADWRLAEARSATFTNLGPGSYSFEVQAANDDGVWNTQGVGLRIEIASPWHFTWWAWALYAIAGSAALYGVVQWRVHRLRVQAQSLEATVSQRTAQIDAQRQIVSRQKKEAEQAKETIQAQAERLAQLDQVKSRFFANISHEFRTPLSLIIGPLQDLLSGKRGSLEERLKQDLEVMHRSSMQLLRLINQLLDLSKLESGRMRLRVIKGDISAFLRTTVLSLASLAERRRVDLQFHSSMEGIEATFDQEKVEKILSNLLTNALKFTSPGGKVRVEASRLDEDGFEIRVRDTGKGISHDELPNIFNRFYQVDGNGQGTGIGLSLTRELVLLHGGAIEVQSDPGFGTTFSVRLPWSPPADSVEAVESEVLEEIPQWPSPASLGLAGTESPCDPSLPDSSAEAQAADAPLVLIVEDNEDVRRYLRSHLQERYRVAEASDGEEGLSIVKAGRPDLVISDLMMPGLDGKRLCQLLKAEAQWNDIPFILLTAKASEESRLDGLESGADDYLCKPFSAQELMVRAENLIEVRRLLRRKFSREVIIQPSQVSVPTSEEAFLDRLRVIVEEHMEDPTFGVTELALESGLSVRQLNRRLQASLKLSASGLIRMMRLSRAESLLSGRFGTVSEVAYAVGFQDPGYFSKLFRQTFGIAPSEYPTERT